VSFNANPNLAEGEEDSTSHTSYDNLTFQGDMPGKEIYNKAVFNGHTGNRITTPTTFTLTVGSTSQSVSIQ